MSTEILLEADNLGISYTRRRWPWQPVDLQWTFRGISFNLARGDSLGVVGANGVGKSSLLRLLSGIIEPDEGRLTNHGARAALMSLSGGFYPELSGVQNILLGGVLLGYTEQEVRERLDEIVEFSALGKDIDKPVNTYSAGMKARLAFSRAAMLEADILLIDEVLSVGDRHFREKCEAFMRERIQSEQTVVYVSHNEKSVSELCSRALWIDKGGVRALGPAEEVVDAYLAD